MGIETNHEYIYYTIINTNQLGPLTREEWFDDGFTWHEAINYVEHLLKNSEDKSVNNYRVDYAGYEQDIGDWVRIHERNKERPVFVQFQDDQPIKTTGEGSMFVLYEEYNDDDDEDEDSEYEGEDEYNNHSPDAEDGLAGLGGRL